MGLTKQQMDDVLAYIEANCAEVEAEYAQVVQQAEENRRYWEDFNRERIAIIAQGGPPAGKEEAWKKHQEKKKELGLK